MRKLPSILPVLGTLAALVAAGCGGSGGSDGSSPLDNALRYLPADAPFAVAIETDTEGGQFQSADELAGRFPGGSDQLSDLVEDALGDRAANLDEIREALGNPFVVGSTDVRSFLDSPDGEDTSFVGAIQASSQDALDKLVEGDRAEEDGEIAGAKVYKDDSGDPFAIDGDVLVVAGSRQELEDALSTRDGDDGMTEDDFEAGVEDVPEDALLRVYLNVAELLRSSPDARDALKSKWVQAVRGAAIALSVRDDRIVVDVEVETDPDGLTEADLPIAAGSGSPQVLDRARDINLALRDPSQLLEFAQATAGAVSPDDFADFEEGKAQIERQLGVDVDEDLIAQLEGDLAVSIGLDGKFGARAQLEDPAAFRRTLERLEEVLPDVARGVAGQKVGFAAPKAGEDFYAVATADGDQVVFGVVDDVFVLSNDATIAGTIAAQGTSAVPGAEGSLVLAADAEELAQALLRQAAGSDFDLGDRITGAIGTRPLDDLVGSIEASTDGLSGSFTLTTDRR